MHKWLDGKGASFFEEIKTRIYVLLDDAAAAAAAADADADAAADADADAYDSTDKDDDSDSDSDYDDDDDDDDGDDDDDDGGGGGDDAPFRDALLRFTDKTNPCHNFAAWRMQWGLAQT